MLPPMLWMQPGAVGDLVRPCDVQLLDTRGDDQRPVYGCWSATNQHQEENTVLRHPWTLPTCAGEPLHLRNGAIDSDAGFAEEHPDLGDAAPWTDTLLDGP